MIHANRAIAQIRKADGFLTGAVQREEELVFWTMTLWRDAHAMGAYGASGAHRQALPHLADWAGEAGVAHWGQTGETLPSWPEAVLRFREDARSSPLRHPGPAHEDRSFAEPRMTRGLRL